jgi:hypothetical protein
LLQPKCFSEDQPHDIESAINFLQQWAPNGPWQLTNISVDKDEICTRFFSATQIEQMRGWIEKANGVKNLYFTVNSLLVPMNKKPSREDVAFVDWLHVDVDSPPDMAIAAAKSVTLEKARNFHLLPTVAIDSGGGIQLFWKLRQPIVIDGNLEKAEAAAHFNVALEKKFSGDHCHNIDRIMRLPGTVNLPDAKKRSKDRVAAPATLLWFEPERIYDLTMFTPAEPDASSSAAKKPQQVSLDDLPEKQQVSLDDLPENMPEWVEHVIQDGDAPQLGHTYPSRSEALFAVCCQLGRHNVRRELAFAIITDHAFKISDSVHFISPGKPRREWRRYAKRQISRAYSTVSSPEIAAMNENHALIQLGNKVRIVTWTRSPIYPNVLLPDFIRADDLGLLYRNRFVTARGQKTVRLLDYWLSHEDRKDYDGITFAPGEDDPGDGLLNIWAGWGVEPAEGDWSLMRRHIREVLASGNEESFSYILKWTAWAFQNPGKPAEVAVVFKGGRGTGKGTYGNAMAKIFGPHSLHISNREDLVGKFNAHLMHCSLLFADEALWPGYKSDEGQLKRLITEPTLAIERKGIDKFDIPNCIHLIMSSNENWIVPAGIDERRFAVFEVDEAYKQDATYFTPLYAENENGGLAAMLHDLLKLNLAGWHPRDSVPQTDALGKQKMQSASPEDRWIGGLLADGILPGPQSRLPNRALSAALFKHARESSPRLRSKSDQELADDLKRCGVQHKHSGANWWVFPPLAEMRRTWRKERPWWPEFDERLEWVAEGPSGGVECAQMNWHVNNE